MKKEVVSMVVVIAASLFLVLSQGVIAGTDSAPKQDGTYVCNCGMDCKCVTTARQAGKCACGKEIEKTGAYACNCGKDCKCGTVANQAGKCVCGLDMKKVQ